MTAALRKDLIFDLNGRSARALIAAHGLGHVQRAAETCIGVGHQRRLRLLGNRPHPVDEIAIGAEPRIRLPEQRSVDPISGHVKRRKSHCVRDLGRDQIIDAGRKDDGSVLHPSLQLGSVISGITGANISAANAYIADVSAPEDRAKNFGLIGACFGVGFILGPALGGLLGSYGLRVPFMAAAGLNLLNALYGFFVLPESHARENRRPFDWKRANPLASLQGLTRYPVVLGLTAVIALERIAHDSLPSVWVLYTTYRFNWTELENGLSLTLVGIMFAIVSAGLTGKMVKKLGERKAIIFGLIVGSISFLVYGLATKGWMMYAMIVLGSIGGIGGAAIQSLITKLVSASEQGAVQGVISSIQAVAAIIGPLMATNLFAYFTSPAAPVHLPGAAFIASSILVAISALLAIRSARAKPMTENVAGTT